MFSSQGLWGILIRVASAIAAAALVWLFSVVVARIVRKNLDALNPAMAMLLSRAVKILGVSAAVFIGVMLLGFNWKGALASAGIAGTVLTMIITFSAQNSISNVFSGIFIITERAFNEGDTIRVGDTLGVVERVGMISTWLRTLDNIMVRIPNSQLLSSVIYNYTRYDIRRIETVVGVSYDADANEAVRVISEALDREPIFLARPEPVVVISELADSSVNIRVMVWIDRRDFFEARSRLVAVIKSCLDEAGIDIPYPQIVVHDADGQARA